MANVKRASALYNDPSIGAIFENLGSMFAPPKATDVYAYARAKAAKEEADRAAELWSSGSNLGETEFDRKAVVLGRGTIANGYTGVRSTADTARYGYDSTAATSRANNTADNDRAMREAIMRDQTDRFKFTKGDVNVAQDGVTLLSPERQAAMGAPEPMVRGNVSASAGETIYPSGGGAPMLGQAVPLSETQDKAREAARLRASGQITDQDMVDTIMGAQAPVKAVDANGRPIYATPGAAARQALKPAPNDVTPSDLGRLQQERDLIQATSPQGANDPRVAEINTRISKLGAAGTTVNVGAAEKALDSGFAQADVKDIVEASNASDAAIRDKSRFDALKESLKSTPSGFGAGIQSYLSEKGIKFGPNASDLEFSKALISAAIPSQRVAGSGTTSDKDMAIFTRALPQIMNTPGGNAAIIDLHQAMNERSIKVGELADRARARELTPTEFRAQVRALPSPLAEFNKSRGLTGDETAAPAPGATTAAASGEVEFVRDANGKLVRKAAQ